MNSKLTFTLLFLTSITVFADEQQPHQGVVYQQTVAGFGYVFHGGDWVKPPYVMEATSDSVFINGLFIHKVQAAKTAAASTPVASRALGQPALGHARTSRRDAPMRRGLPRRRRHPPQMAAPVGLLASETYDPDHGMSVYSEEHGDEEHEEETSEAEYMAMEIGEVLSNGGAVIAFSDAEPVLIPDGIQISEFAKTLSSRDNLEVEQRFVNSCRQDSRATIREWLANFQPSSELLATMASVVAEYDQLEADALFQIQAVQWLDWLNYPLTMVGMLLGVVAFGHILKWAATMVSQQGALANVQCTKRAIYLIGGMSVLDLVWTMAAYYAGAMREINPLAATLISSPGQLVLFKLMATGLGASILYAWRNRTQIQQATWWMCLVCVLLTFRWVVFDSVMN